MEKTEVFVRAFRVRLALGMFVPELRKSVKLVPPLFRLYRGWINVSEGERYVPWIILLLVLAGVIGGDCVGELRIAVFLSQAVYNRPMNSTVVFRSAILGVVDAEGGASPSCFCTLAESGSLGNC